MLSSDDAVSKLYAAGVFFGESPAEDAEDFAGFERCLNLNDAMHWATADCERVSYEEAPEVWDLFFRYGWCGILYWVCKKRDETSSFEDVRRMVQFVKAEEKLRREVPSSSARAFRKLTYCLGGSGD